MANEKVSQMAEMSANNVAGNDVFLIIDTSLKESKKIQVNSVVDYLIYSSSYNVESASFSDTASFAKTVVTASHALRATTSSYAIFSTDSATASYALVAASAAASIENANTASFLTHSFARSNGTSSFAITASFVRNGYTSSFLNWTSGRNNGTASWAITASNAQSASVAISASYGLRSKTSSYCDGLIESASFSNKAYTSSFLHSTASWATTAISSTFLNYIPGVSNGTSSYTFDGRRVDTASYVDKGSPNVVKAWANIIWLAGKANPTINKSYNISEFKYLGEHDPGSTSLYFQTLWGVTFNTTLPSTDYTLVGTGKKLYGTLGTAYGALEDAPVMIFPNEQVSPKYTSGFTMSMAVLSQIYTAWFTAVGGANWYNQRTASVEFMIVGN